MNIDRYENNPLNLKLSWKISSFLPVPSSEDTIDEYLDPEAFKDAEYIKNVWSIPESLLDIRWAKEAAEVDDFYFSEHNAKGVYLTRRY